MKSKKLISFLCAAALTVSSFAGLTINAGAAAGDPLSSQNFNSLEEPWVYIFGGDKADRVTISLKDAPQGAPSVVTGKTLNGWNDNNNAHAASIAIDPAISAVPSTNVYDVDFDLFLNPADKDWMTSEDESAEPDVKFYYSVGVGNTAPNKLDGNKNGQSASKSNMSEIAVSGNNVYFVNGSTDTTGDEADGVITSWLKNKVDTGIDLPKAGAWYHVKFSANVTTKKYNATITPYNGNDLDTAHAFRETDMTFPSSSFKADEVALTSLCFSSERMNSSHKGYFNLYFDNFVASEGAAVELADVTVNYVLNGSSTPFKTENVKAEIGKSYAAEDSMKANIKASEIDETDTTHYYKYTSTGSTETVANVATSGNVVTLNFTKEDYVDFTVNAVKPNGDVIKQLYADKYAPGDTASFYYSYYITDTQGNYYAAKNMSTSLVQKVVGNEATTATVVYKPQDNIKFFKEAEEYTKEDGTLNDAVSNRADFSGGVINRGPAFSDNKNEGFETDAVDAAGDYEFTFVAHASKRGEFVSIVDKDGNATNITADEKYAKLVTDKDGTKYFDSGKFTLPVTLAEGDKIRVWARTDGNNIWGNKASNRIDYLLLTQGEATSVEPTVTLDYTKSNKTATISVTNMGEVGDDVPVTLIHSSYNSDNTLKDVKVYNKTVPVANTATSSVTQALSETVAEGDKIMIWDALNGLKPYKPAITIDETNADDVTPPATTYTVTVASGIANGTVTATPNTAVAEGTEVNVTAEPAQGYELATLTYTKGTDSPVDIKGTKKFNMPAGDVTINATFTATSSTPTKTDVTAATLTATYDATAGKVTAALSAVDPEAATNAFTIAWLSGDAENAVTTPGAGTGAEITSPTPGKYYKAVATISDNATYNNKTVESNVVFVPYPTYTVGGTITGTGITSVKLTGTRTRGSEAVNTSATPSEGAYSFTVEAGTYTITPEFVADNYAVTPANYENVAVSADDNTKNFKVTPKLKGKPVIKAEDNEYITGKALSVDVAGLNGKDATLTYAWYYKATAEAEYPQTAEATTATIEANAVKAGYYKVVVTADGYDGSSESDSVKIEDAAATRYLVTVAVGTGVDKDSVKIDGIVGTVSGENLTWNLTAGDHTLAANPADHYKDVTFSGTGVDNSTKKITVSNNAIADVQVSATQKTTSAVSKTVTPNAQADNIVIKSGADVLDANALQTVDEGTVLTVDTSAATTAGYTVESIEVTEAANYNSESKTFTIPTTSTSITVTVTLSKTSTLTSTTGKFYDAASEGNEIKSAKSGATVYYQPNTADEHKKISTVTSSEVTLTDPESPSVRYSFTMPEQAVTVTTAYVDKTASVKYTAATSPNTLAVTSSDNTEITAGTAANVKEGSTLTITATPTTGQKVTGISVKIGEAEAVVYDGTTDKAFTSLDATTGVATKTVSVASEDAIVIEATFAAVDYTIRGTGEVKASAAQDAPTVGTVTLTKIGEATTNLSTANAGQEVSFTAVPASGYQLSSVKVTYGTNSEITVGGAAPNNLTVTPGTQPSDNTTYTFTMPAGNVSIQATFYQSEATITPDMTYVSYTDDEAQATDYRTNVANGDPVLVGKVGFSSSGMKTGSTSAGYTGFQYGGIASMDVSEYVGKIKKATWVLNVVSNDTSANTLRYVVAPTYIDFDTAETISANTVSGDGIGGKIPANVINIGSVPKAADGAKDISTDITRVLRSIETGKLTVAIGSTEGHIVKINSMSLLLELAEDTISDASVTVNQVYNNGESNVAIPTTTSTTDAANWAAGDTYSTTMGDTATTDATGKKTFVKMIDQPSGDPKAKYIYASGAADNQTLTAGENVINLLYTQYKYSTATFTATVDGTEAEGVVIKLSGTPDDGSTFTATTLTTEAGGTKSIDLLPGTYKYEVEETGTHKAAAEATLTVANDGGPDSATIALEGKSQTLASIAIDDSALNTGILTTSQASKSVGKLSATEKDADDIAMATQGGVDWSSSDNEKVTVDKNGNVAITSAATAGEYTITATAKNNSGITATKTITVSATGTETVKAASEDFEGTTNIFGASATESFDTYGVISSYLTTHKHILTAGKDASGGEVTQKATFASPVIIDDTVTLSFNPFLSYSSGAKLGVALKDSDGNEIFSFLNGTNGMTLTSVSICGTAQDLSSITNKTFVNCSTAKTNANVNGYSHGTQKYADGSDCTVTVTIDKSANKVTAVLKSECTTTNSKTNNLTFEATVDASKLTNIASITLSSTVHKTNGISGNALGLDNLLTTITRE